LVFLADYSARKKCANLTQNLRLPVWAGNADAEPRGLWLRVELTGEIPVA